MAANAMHNTTELVPRLQERGIELSRTQVYRLVQQRPERISLQLLAALCDIFACGVDDLVTVTAADVRSRRVANAKKTTAPPAHSATNVVALNKAIRPKRARVIIDDD